jgi:DNA-binding transcriptional LysR family regulator
VAKRVGKLGFALYASKKYLERHPPPPPGQTFEGHELIDDDEEQLWAPEVKWARALTTGARVAARMQTWQGRLIAAESGAGLAVLPCLLGDASRALRRVGSPSEPVTHDLWLLVHRELRQVARIRVVHDFVARLVAEMGPQLEGTQA